MPHGSKWRSSASKPSVTSSSGDLEVDAQLGHEIVAASARARATSLKQRANSVDAVAARS